MGLHQTSYHYTDHDSSLYFMDQGVMPHPYHAGQEEFENGGFTLKTHQMFSVHTTPEEFKNTTFASHFGFVFEEKTQSGK